MALLNMTHAERDAFDHLARRWQDDAFIHLMDNFTQHGVITTYDHCLRVARIAFLANRRLHLEADEEALITGAMLHDFFLYDWHGTDQGLTEKYPAIQTNPHLQKLPTSKITHRPVGTGPGDWTHSYKHPLIACENASLLFDLTEKEKDIIRSHMWPLTFWHFPGSLEAWIVSFADKYCSAGETIFRDPAHHGKEA